MKNYGPDIHKANGLMKSGAFDEAEKILRAVTAASPQESTAWHVLGRTYFLQNKFELAETCFRQRLVLDSEKAIANYSLALVLTQLKRYDEAKFYVSHALRIDSNYTPAKALNQHLISLDKTKTEQQVSAIRPVKGGTTPDARSDGSKRDRAPLPKETSLLLPDTDDEFLNYERRAKRKEQIDFRAKYVARIMGLPWWGKVLTVLPFIFFVFVLLYILEPSREELQRVQAERQRIQAEIDAGRRITCEKARTVGVRLPGC